MEIVPLIEMIEVCDKSKTNKTLWDIVLIDSVRKRLDNGKPLTDDQNERLISLWKRLRSNT